MYLPSIFAKLPLWEKSLVFFVYSSYLQIFIYLLSLFSPDSTFSFLNSLRLVFILILVFDSLKATVFVRLYPAAIVFTLIIFLPLSILFSLNDIQRITSGLISFLPLLLLILCLAQTKVAPNTRHKTFFWLRSQIRILLYIAVFFCFLNNYFWKIGLLTIQFGGAISFFGLLPRNTSFFSVPGTSGSFAIACILLLHYFEFISPSRKSLIVLTDILCALLIILWASAAAAFLSLLIFLLVNLPYILPLRLRDPSLQISFASVLGRLFLVCIPLFFLSAILGREDVFSSSTGRFSIFVYFSDKLNGIPVLPNPSYFGLATNYAQTTFGTSDFVQTPDSLLVSLLVQYGIVLSVGILLCLYLPLIYLLANSIYRLTTSQSLSLSLFSLCSFTILLSILPIIFTINVLEAYPFIFFLTFFYSSPLVYASRVASTHDFSLTPLDNPDP